MITKPRRIGQNKKGWAKARKMLKKASKRLVAQRKPKKRGGLPSISKLIKACDKEFSILVRQTEAFRPSALDTDLYNNCYTCDLVFPIKKLHAGHYLSRYYKAARWDFDNARPQCFMCNIYKKGDVVVFRRNLIEEIGEARVLAVEKLRDAPIKLTREFLTQKLEELKTAAPQPTIRV